MAARAGKARAGSEESLRAVEWAAREAVLHSAPLRVVSAASLPRTASLQHKPERDVVLGFVREHRDRALASCEAGRLMVHPPFHVGNRRLAWAPTASVYRTNDRPSWLAGAGPGDCRRP
jgi:hypothetical protein